MSTEPVEANEAIVAGNTLYLILLHYWYERNLIAYTHCAEHTYARIRIARKVHKYVINKTSSLLGCACSLMQHSADAIAVLVAGWLAHMAHWWANIFDKFSSFSAALVGFSLSGPDQPDDNKPGAVDEKMCCASMNWWLVVMPGCGQWTEFGCIHFIRIQTLVSLRAEGSCALV